MKIAIRILLAFSICFLSGNIIISQKVGIDLKKVMELAGANNLSIKMYEQQQIIAAAEDLTAKEWWIPDLYAGIKTHQLGGAVMNGNGNFFIDVKRNNLWAGLGLNASWDFANGVYTKKISSIEAERTRHLTQAERNDVLLEAIETYYDFLAAQLYFKTYESLVKQSDTITRQIEVQVEAGLTYQSELLLSKSNQNQLKVEMLNAKITFKQKSASLVRLLNLDPKIELIALDSLLTPLELSPGITDDFNFTTGYNQNPEIRALALSVESVSMSRKSINRELLFPTLQVNMDGAFFGGLTGSVNPMVPSENLNPNMLYPTGSLNLGLLWKVPLGRLFSSGEIKKLDEELIYKEIQLSEIKSRINESLIRANEELRHTKMQMDLASEANQYAREALKQSMLRQAIGTVRPYEVFHTQEVVIRSKLSQLESVANYNKAQYRFFIANGNNL